MIIVELKFAQTNGILFAHHPDGMGGKVAPAGKEAPNMKQNAWGVPMPNITVEVSPGKKLTVDELVYGFEFERRTIPIAVHLDN